MKLENIKFGDRFKTRNGELAIVIGEHKTALKHWYDFVCLREDSDMINHIPYKFCAYDDGRAFEGFDWLDIVEKI